MKMNKKLFGMLFCIIFTWFILKPTGGVRADVAPPEMPPGSNPVPGEEQTQVQMVAETVILEVQPTAHTRASTYQDWNLVDDWAMVTATFTMRNQGNQEESMKVRFPLVEWQGNGDHWFNFPEITNFRVFVNNQEINWSRITTPNPNEGEDFPPIAWAAFDVTFPPAEDVAIVVKYDSIATGYPPFSDFRYILETGAGWKDAIGSADIILRLPYEASPENAGFTYTIAGGEYIGNDIRWHFENLEPSSEDNIYVEIVQVPVWQEVINARKTLEDNPNSGEAWGRLARAYKMAILYSKGWLRDDEAGKILFEQSDQAYQKAVELSPETARWHAGYAELLWASMSYSSSTDYATLERVVRELNTAIELDPENEQAINMLLNISLWLPEAVEDNGNNQFTMHILTATIPYESVTLEVSEVVSYSPTTPPAEVPSSTPTPQSTSTQTTAPNPTTETKAVPTKQPAATSTPVKTNRLPICGSILIFPAVLMLAWLIRRQIAR